MSTRCLRPMCALLLAALAACGGKEADAASAGAAVGSSSGARPAEVRPPFEAATAPADPCAWILAKEVEGILGALEGPPVRSRAGSQPRPDPRGEACLYTLAEKPRTGRGTVTLAVQLDGGLGDMATTVSEGVLGPRSAAAADSAAKHAARRGWDHESTAGLTYFARVGHVGVQVDLGSIEIPKEAVERLAIAVRDRVPDRPFVNPPDPDLEALRIAAGDPPEPPPSGPDPCALVSRAEAEAVLGQLAAPPYRSSGTTPLWSAWGEGCSYYTGNHRVLTLKPTRAGGQAEFRMAAGLGAVGTSATGAQTFAADTLDGPWEDVMQDLYGKLRFLKGDRMLEVVWTTSGTDQAGALKLASQALGRL